MLNCTDGSSVLPQAPVCYSGWVHQCCKRWCGGLHLQPLSKGSQVSSSYSQWMQKGGGGELCTVGQQVVTPPCRIEEVRNVFVAPVGVCFRNILSTWAQLESSVFSFRLASHCSQSPIGNHYGSTTRYNLVFQFSYEYCQLYDESTKIK